LDMLAFGCVLVSHHDHATVLNLDEIPQEIWTPIAISDLPICNIPILLAAFLACHIQPNIR
jgi:hypothetical protein